MSNFLYGYNISYDDFIDEVIKCFKGTKDYFYNKQLLIELYETKYGICDHVNTTNPLASVQFNQAEDYFSDTLYHSYLSNFVYRDLGKKLNMSFDDFISRPRYEIEAMLRIIEDVDKKKSKMNDDIMKDLENNKPKPFNTE